MRSNPFFELGRRPFLKTVLLIGAVAALTFWTWRERPSTLKLTPAKYEPASEKPLSVPQGVLNLQESFSTVAEAVKPAVVNIATVHIEKYQENPYEFFFWNPDDLFEHFMNPNQPRRRGEPPQQRQRQQRIPGTGSGVIIDSEGYILTNEHVVRDADEIKVTLANDPDKKLDGKVIGRDERTDLAVVKIRASGKLPYAKLGDSDAIKVGDWAIAIGSPFGLEQTVTVGVISAVRQNLPIEGRAYRALIQTDAAINPGNSGGPLLNIHGEVIGVNTAIYTPSGGFAGIGFAIPINRAKEILPQLRSKGKVVRGWIGVVLEERLDEATAKVFGIPDKHGVLLREVLAGYPAARAGLRRGDVIREFNGQKIKDNNDLQNAIAATAPGTQCQVKFIRDRKEMTANVITGEAPSMNALKKGLSEDQPSLDRGSAEEEKWLGASVSPLTPELRERYRVPPSESGVLVTSVQPASTLEEAGLTQGDVIRAINQEAVSDLASFKAASKKAKPQNGIVLDILRRGESIYLSYMGPEK